MKLDQSLKLDQFLEQARHESGLSDFGDEGFTESLAILLDCLAKDCNFYPDGLAEFNVEVVRYLVNRLRFQADVTAHPEILDEDVSDPIIILGLPRNGTTKTHRMIGTDTNLLTLRTWQMFNFAPFPDAVPGQPDPRIAAAATTGDTLATDRPEVQAAHHFAVDAIEEDWFLYEFTFNDWSNMFRNPSRLFHEWVISREHPSDASNFRYVRSMYQYLQWQQGGRRDRRWLMKTTGALGLLDPLLDTYPNATLVHIHRHPFECVPSFLEIMATRWAMRTSHGRADVDIALDWETQAIARYLEARDRLHLDDRILDIQYTQVRDDPRAAAEQIYRHAGQTLTDETCEKILGWSESNYQHRFGPRGYTLEEFGLTESAVLDRFGEYVDRFIDAAPKK
jgi:hypothetical protein